MQCLYFFASSGAIRRYFTQMRKDNYMIKRDLKDNFQISISGQDTWYGMSVPGSAMDTFCKEGILPDPSGYGTASHGSQIPLWSLEVNCS